jgi:AGZA family xanthine/uracil permease-like MFS transporter
LGAGIIVTGTATTTALVSLRQPATLIAIAGILLTVILTVRRAKGALLLGIFGTASLGWLSGVAPLPEKLLDIPQLPLDLVGQAIVCLGFSQSIDAGIGKWGDDRCLYL